MALPPTPYDACEKVSTRATSISMVRYRTNDYSVPVAYAHREVQIRGYVHEVVIGCGADMSYQDSTDIRESLERSITRLSRTYLAQMDALKKYRAKAQQVVRVERVTVHEGGQAIVGDVSHGGEGCR